MLTRLTKYLSITICYCLLAGFIGLTLAGGKWQRHTVIKNDAAGYYVYLPSLFIYKDPLKCKFYYKVDSTYNFADGVYYYGVHYYPPTQNFYFKYNYGVATFEAPLFLLAHTITKVSGFYTADGYSALYQLSVALSAILFTFLALLLLRKFLLEYFNDTVTAITLLIITIGTNLFAQVITQPGLSHTYLFFLYAVILYATQQLYKTYLLKWYAVLGIAVGLCAVTRPTDVLIALFPLLWAGCGGILPHLKRHFGKIALAVSISLAFVTVQMFYWKISTGHWYLHTYKYEYFDFGNWQIVNGLFSYRKGWFVYTPLALLGFIGAYFIWQQKNLRFYLPAFVVYYVATLYIVFCWWQWYYGGSFGCRVMVQSYAIMALPIAALIYYLLSTKTIWRALSFSIIAILIVFNVFQTMQYAKGVIHWQKMNKEYYWRTFGKWNVSEQDKLLLNNTPEITTGNKYRR